MFPLVQWECFLERFWKKAFYIWCNSGVAQEQDFPFQPTPNITPQVLLLCSHTSKCILHCLTKLSRKPCNTAIWCRAKTHRTCTVRAAGLQQYLSPLINVFLYVRGSVLTTTLFPHFFGGWVAELRANTSQHNQILPSSVFGEKKESSWVSRPEIPHIFPYIYTYLLLKTTLFCLRFCLTISHFQLLQYCHYFTIPEVLYSIVLNYFCCCQETCFSITMTKEKDMFTNLF